MNTDAIASLTSGSLNSRASCALNRTISTSRRARGCAAPLPVPQQDEHGEPILVAADRLAIDQAGTHPEPVNGLDDERIARGPIVPIPGRRVPIGSRRAIRR